MALAFLFGDELGAFAAFVGDAVAAVLVAGLFAARHHCRAVGARCLLGGGEVEFAGGLGQRGEHGRTVGLGAIDMAGGSGQNDGPIGALLIGPARTERLDQMVASN